MSLFAVPGTPARGAEAGLEGDQVFEEFAGLPAGGLLAIAFGGLGFFLFKLAWRHLSGRLLGERKTVRHAVGIHNRKSDLARREGGFKFEISNLKFETKPEAPGSGAFWDAGLVSVCGAVLKC